MSRLTYVFATPEPRKEEGSMPGNLIFKNVVIGGLCPNGLKCRITIKDNGYVVCDKYPLEFQENFAYTPRTANITVTIKPTAPQMGSCKIENKNKNKKGGTPQSDITYYICEDPYAYKVSVFSNKNHVPQGAQPYV
jgi:hypothetical protein